MGFSPLSRAQKIVIWASLSLALLAVLYPGPSFRRTSRYGFDDSRRFLGDFNQPFIWNIMRPNYLRMATEVIVILLIGGGLVVALKGGRAMK